MIKLKVEGQYLNIKERMVLASDSQDYVKATFEFDDDWNGLTKTAVFYQNADTVYHAILVDDSCIVPYEALAEKEQLYIGVFGVEETKRITTNFVNVFVHEGSYGDGITPPEPSEDIYAQIIGIMNEQKADAEATLEAQETTEGYRDETLGLKTDVENIRDAFDINATNKTNIFNDNASSKTNLFNSNYDEKIVNLNTVETTTDGYKNTTKDYMDTTEEYKDLAFSYKESAKESETNAGLEADRALNNILNGVSTHNQDVESHPSLIEDIRTVESIARGKADKTYVDTQDALKADKTYVDSQDALKADKNYVDSQDALKADKTYVDSQDALKADKTYVDTQDALKADKTYVDSQDALKADATALTALTNLVPAATGLTTVTGKNQYYPIVEDNTGAIVGKRLLNVWDGTSWVAAYANGFGHAALYGNKGAYANGFGSSALANNTGTYANGFGHFALRNNTGANANGFGHAALQNNTGANANGFGYYALLSNTGANANGFGYAALYGNKGAYANGFGHFALRNNTGANANGFGHAALQNNTGANANGFGYYALLSNTGDGANGFGYAALRNNTGVNNSAFGHNANNTTDTTIQALTNTTCLGANTLPNKSNQVVLGDGSVDTVKMGGTARTPASSTAPGVKGETCWDTNYFYICVATNIWKRIPMEVW